jgi:hypothetical protein
MLAQQEKQAEPLENALLFRLGRIATADFSLVLLMSTFSLLILNLVHVVFK